MACNHVEKCPECRAAQKATNAALAQAQTERDEWKEGYHEVVRERNTAQIALARMAPPPALPPLPEGWVAIPTRARMVFRNREDLGKSSIYLDVEAEGVRVETCARTQHFNPADLITVLRHAAAHLKLQEGQP